MMPPRNRSRLQGLHLEIPFLSPRRRRHSGLLLAPLEELDNALRPAIALGREFDVAAQALGDLEGLGHGALWRAGRASVTDDILTVEQAAEFLQFTPWLVRRGAARGELPARRTGDTFEFPKAKLISWVRNDPEPAPMTRGGRRSRALRNATPQWVDHYLIGLVYIEAKRLQHATGIAHEVDHIVPLQHPNVCGLHVHYNLRPIPLQQNRSKWNIWRDESDSGEPLP